MKRLGLVYLAVFFVLVGLWFIERPHSHGDAEVVFFDVGQGDSSLFRAKNDDWIGLIDAGGGFGDFDRGKDILRELTRSGILRLDLFLMSHPDQDHLLGFQTLLSEQTAHEWAMHEGYLRNPPPLLQRVLGVVQAKDLAIRSVREPRELQIPGGSFAMIPISGSSKRNDICLVAFAEVGGCRFLWTGDLEEPGESQLLNWWGSYVGKRVHVLKVGHHGSKTSTSERFLSEVSPRVAVISAGAGNTYGHPHVSTLNRLREHEATILRTDFHGAVRFTVDKKRIHCESVLGQCGDYDCD